MKKQEEFDAEDSGWKVVILISNNGQLAVLLLAWEQHLETTALHYSSVSKDMLPLLQG